MTYASVKQYFVRKREQDESHVFVRRLWYLSLSTTTEI